MQKGRFILFIQHLDKSQVFTILNVRIMLAGKRKWESESAHKDILMRIQKLQNNLRMSSNNL